MIGKELISVLKTFNSQEIKELNLFLKSPYFTQGKRIPVNKIQQLFSELIKYHPEFDSTKLSFEKIYKKIYGKSDFNESIIRNLISKLLNLTEEYIAQKVYSEKEIEKNLNLLGYYYAKRLDKNFEKCIKACNVILNKPHKDSEALFSQHKIADYLSGYRGRTSYKNTVEIENVTTSFLNFTIYRALQVYMIMIIQETVINHKYKKEMFGEIMQYLKTNLYKYSDIPEIPIYYNLILLFQTDDSEHFFELKNLKDKYLKRITALDLNNLYVCLGNYCLKKIAEGDISYHKERFELDKDYFASGLLEKKGVLRMPLILSACMNALTLKKYDWIEKILSEFSNRLPEEYKEYTENYINAEVMYSKEKYDKALEFLSKIKIELGYYKQLLRNLTIKIYFEKNILMKFFL